MRGRMYEISIRIDIYRKSGDHMRSKASCKVVSVEQIFGYSVYRFSDGSEYKVRDLYRDTSIPEDAEAATYAERIAPQCIPLDDALKARGLTRSEWCRQREEAAMTALYGCPVKTIISVCSKTTAATCCAIPFHFCFIGSSLYSIPRSTL